ncbi:hypothetical protein LB505_011886 [Fusarium chuoi]|nr:hypothetical protein LB505_011886 [Fusarium chuoi]
MTDRHRYPSSGRAATFANHARTSLPSSIGYTSLYAGDMHVMPTSTRQQPISTTPRGYVTTTSTTPTPSTTTRTYATDYTGCHTLPAVLHTRLYQSTPSNCHDHPEGPRQRYEFSFFQCSSRKSPEG